MLQRKHGNNTLHLSVQSHACSLRGSSGSCSEKLADPAPLANVLTSVCLYLWSGRKSRTSPVAIDEGFKVIISPSFFLEFQHLWTFWTAMSTEPMSPNDLPFVLQPIVKLYWKAVAFRVFLMKSCLTVVSQYIYIYYIEKPTLSNPKNKTVKQYSMSIFRSEVSLSLPAMEWIYHWCTPSF